MTRADRLLWLLVILVAAVMTVLLVLGAAAALEWAAELGRRLGEQA